MYDEKMVSVLQYREKFQVWANVLEMDNCLERERETGLQTG